MVRFIADDAEVMHSDIPGDAAKVQDLLERLEAFTILSCTLSSHLQEKLKQTSDPATSA